MSSNNLSSIDISGLKKMKCEDFEINSQLNYLIYKAKFKFL